MNADIENVKRTQCASHTSKLNKKCDKLQLTWSLNQCLFYNSWNFGGNEVYGGVTSAKGSGLWRAPLTPQTVFIGRAAGGEIFLFGDQVNLPLIA